jgi:hypothetical protein
VRENLVFDRIIQLISFLKDGKAYLVGGFNPSEKY